MKHGTRASYFRRYRQRRIAERVEIDGRLVHPDAPHGTDNGYLNYHCRCQSCAAAGSKRNALGRQRRRAEKERAA